MLATIVRGQSPFTPEDEQLLEEMEQRAWRFFEEQAHPQTGLVRDRARADGAPTTGMASIAASGFALDAWVIATERGWTTRETAVERVRTALRFLADTAPRRHGFYYHFMDMETGARARQCELSSIDTALFLAGAIVAREYFQNPEITALVDRIFAAMDWQWFLNGGLAIDLGWRDEGGFLPYRWDNYSEHLFMHLLALGAPAHAIGPESWRAWRREPVGTYAGFTYLQQAPLFIHQFSHAYVDFRGRRDAWADYFRNSELATLAQRQFAIDLQPEFPAWGPGLWGITASDSITGYKAWGGPPRTTGRKALDGTIVPCAAAGSLPFAPAETMEVLRTLREDYGDEIWKRYGFVDAFNPHTGWVNPDVIGIDLGISMVMAENARTGLIWSLFSQAPEVQRGVAQAGLYSSRRALTTEEAQLVSGIGMQAWQLLRAKPRGPENLGLQVTALSAARALGWLDVDSSAAHLRELLDYPAPADVAALAQYAAGLVVVRQAWPEVAAAATQFLQAINWAAVTPGADQLGSGDRLAVFFQIASDARAAATWARLKRDTVVLGDVAVLQPARVPDQYWPGLWLDESTIVTGASASQLAYAHLASWRQSGGAAPVPEPQVLSLLLDHFPTEVLPAWADVGEAWWSAASEADLAALVVTSANLLDSDVVRRWFQQDPFVLAGRSALTEFAEGAFGPNTSIFQQRELAIR